MQEEQSLTSQAGQQKVQGQKDRSHTDKFCNIYLKPLFFILFG
jgi:hypothetical protein